MPELLITTRDNSGHLFNLSAIAVDSEQDLVECHNTNFEEDTLPTYLNSL